MADPETPDVDDSGAPRQGIELDTFFDMSLDLLCVADLEGHFRWLSPSWQNVLGYGLDELIGRKFIELVHPDDQQATLTELERLSHGHDTVHFENRYRTRAGEYRWLAWRSPAPRPAAKFVYAIARDVTEQRRAEQRIHELNRRLERATRVGTMGEMAVGMAHEFHQPLAAITNYANGCLKRLRSDEPELEKVVEGLQRIVDESLRAGQLLRRIRDFVSERRPVRGRVLVDSVVDDALCMTRTSHPEATVKMEYLPEHTGLAVHCDEIELLGALSHVCANAVEAMAGVEGRMHELRVTAALQSGNVEIAVSDTGPGVSDEDRQRIFDQFYTTRDSGTGLGLSFARSVVENCGGRLWVTSCDEGATFHICLPAALD